MHKQQDVAKLSAFIKLEGNYLHTFTNLRVIAVSLHLEVDQATPSTSGRPVGHYNYLQKNRQPAILPNRKEVAALFLLSHKGVTSNLARTIFYICLANIFSLVLATL